MADASGMKLLRSGESDPLHASTFGTGELMKHALDMGVTRIIIGVGGSATTDGGCGILRALGIRFLNIEREDLKTIPYNLTDLCSIDVSGLDPRILRCEIIVLCDVANTLTGPQGAAAVFSPQKGATLPDVERLQTGLEKFNEITLLQTSFDMSSVKYGGAAGGTAAGLFAYLNAQLVSGIDYFLHLTGFDEALDKSDIMITAEGSIDEQTLQGKGPFGVACRAKAKNIPVIGIAGKVPLQISTALQRYFDVLIPIENEPLSLEMALTKTTDNLIRTSAIVAKMLQLGSSAIAFRK
jgi:glycerate kinase